MMRVPTGPHRSIKAASLFDKRSYEGTEDDA